MKKYFTMDCDKVLDTVYEAEKAGSLPILTQVRIDIHLLFCPACAGELKKLRHVEEVMKTDFLPLSPNFGDLVMECLSEETALEGATDAPTGFSFLGWIVIGFFVLLSLSSAFFGMNFVEIADAVGLSFLLPVGMTIGVVLTCYGALFIGSHLKELSERFGLR